MSNNDKINRDMVSYYGDSAEDYDQQIRKAADDPRFKPSFEVATRILQETFVDHHVLEVAAGTGLWTGKIAEKAASVTATDINRPNLGIAQRYDYPKGNVTFHVADMYALNDFPKHDALFGGFWLSHELKQNLPQFIDTMNAYVVPGSPVVFLDTAPTSSPHGRVDEFGNRYQLRTPRDKSKHEVVKNYPTEKELRELLRGRGSNIEFAKLEHLWVLKYKTLTP